MWWKEQTGGCASISFFFNIPILLDDFEKSESETSVIMGNVVKLLLEVEPTSY